MKLCSQSYTQVLHDLLDPKGAEDILSAGMWTISQKRLRDFWEVHPDAERPLRLWYKVVSKASWASLPEVRRVYPHADPVTLDNGTTLTVFNVGGNKYRLITRIAFARHKIYVKRVLTHAEYAQDNWKRQL